MQPAEPALVDRLRAAGCVFAEDEARLLAAAAPDPRELERLVGRRVAGVPLELLLGWAGFGGLRIAVAAGVFVPRRRTEALAEAAAACAAPHSKSSEPPGASQPAAPATTRRASTSPSGPPSSAVRGSWSRASGGISARASVGT